ncbi:hypothetical protein [Agrobacterium bohemicum]|uniref:Uncharacterized protein n=1 Tax=Agrobacterium bohemicum TaxID=2052828 RepID=A0A135P8F7_9HYPH|nr:hypothetical protein [Agrobacterium bohemicum]KXG87704.1 hypothetical protein ATO67_18240 [Agrobacterium bohemicum]
MRKDQIPEFVDEIIATGCPICAVGHDTYVFGEIDVLDEDFDRVVREVQEICDNYGERDHLRLEIAAYLRSIGRVFDLPEETVH